LCRRSGFSKRLSAAGDFPKIRVREDLRSSARDARKLEFNLS
jgi:hypothetical protein